MQQKMQMMTVPVENALDGAEDDVRGPSTFIRSRRSAVSSESGEDGCITGMECIERNEWLSLFAVSREAMEAWIPPSFPKTDVERDFLREVVNTKLGLLFGHLEKDHKELVINAMSRREVPAEHVVIKQGDNGDYFYIVYSGRFEITVSRNGQPAQKVMEAAIGSSFGELALLYNAPRAATCKSLEPSVVWALDRSSFKMMLVTTENSKKRRYERFLEDIDIFKALNRYERCQLSDILTAEKVADGHCIISQGEVGDRFYIVEEGECRCTMRDAGGPELEVLRYRRGGFFGELALMCEGPRKASVYAVGNCSLLWIDKPTFDRVLGPILDILRKNADEYPSYEHFLSLHSSGAVKVPNSTSGELDADC